MTDRAIFSIHLVEDEHGRVTVFAEGSGPAFNAYEIGIEILDNLRMAEAEHPDAISVGVSFFSEAWH